MTTHAGGPAPGESSDTSDAEDLRVALAQAVELHDHLRRAAPEHGHPVVAGSVELGVVADRLAASVVRPLKDALTSLSGSRDIRLSPRPSPSRSANR